MPGRMRIADALLRLVKSMLTIVAGVLVGLPLLLFAMQDGMIFYPQPAPRIAPSAPHVQAVQVTAGDGLTLSGWLARPIAASPGERVPLVIYFGGNAEEVSHMMNAAARLGSWALLAVNYRGYGGNPGTPGQAALFADALALYDWAAARADVDATRIAVMGRSLGSGVAVHVAAERKTAGVVLVTPFDSLRAVAQSIYPFVPVSLLLRHPFDSAARAPAIGAPMLALVAGRDEVIPARHARRLFEAWRGPKFWRAFAAAGHDSISDEPAYWASIREFLDVSSR